MVDDPILQCRCMGHPQFSLIVRQFLFGQLRIQLIDRLESDPDRQIKREMCTYQMTRMRTVVTCLFMATDPLAYCRRLERPWNCEDEGGRIRLDNRLADRPEMVGLYNEDGTPINRQAGAPS